MLEVRTVCISRLTRSHIADDSVDFYLLKLSAKTNRDMERKLKVEQIWNELYQAAKAVQNPRDISERISAGGVAAAIQSASGKIWFRGVLTLRFLTATFLSRPAFRQV